MLKILRHSRCFWDIISVSEERWDGHGEGVHPDEDDDKERPGVGADLALLHVLHAHPPVHGQGGEGADRNGA